MKLATTSQSLRHFPLTADAYAPKIKDFAAALRSASYEDWLAPQAPTTQPSQKPPHPPYHKPRRASPVTMLPAPKPDSSSAARQPQYLGEAASQPQVLMREEKRSSESRDNPATAGPGEG